MEVVYLFGTSEEYTKNASNSCLCHEFFVNNPFAFRLTEQYRHALMSILIINWKNYPPYQKEGDIWL